MHSDENLKLFLAGRFALRVHQLWDLVRGPEPVGPVQTIGQGIVGSISVLETLLLTCPVEELGSGDGVVLDLEHLGDEVGRNPAELSELRDDWWAPVVLVLAERVENEARDRGEK